ncbi:MAG: hypothetical protein K8H88_28810 [Sandaracinaceae bacterium]|nr:hypothetical protein [Sandaracinaceae bacterium]
MRYLLLSILLLACGGGTGPVDGGPRDAPPHDGGGLDVRGCDFLAGRQPTDSVLVFEGQTEDVTVLLMRRPTTDIGFMTTFTLAGFGLRRGADLRCLTADLEYDSTHHNWVDSATARLDGVRYVVEMRYQPITADPTSTWDWRYWITGYDASDAVVWGRHDLDLVEGTPGGGY